MKKSDLMNFAAFIFRSGEENYKRKNNIELDSNIREYIETTFKDFARQLKSEKVKKTQDVIELIEEWFRR